MARPLTRGQKRSLEKSSSSEDDVSSERPSKVAKQNHANVSSEPVTIPDSASVVVVDSTAAASKESRADGSGIDNALILPDAVGDKLSVVLPATQQQTTVTLSVVSPEAVPLPLSMRDEAAGSDTSVDVLAPSNQVESPLRKEMEKSAEEETPISLQEDEQHQPLRVVALPAKVAVLFCWTLCTTVLAFVCTHSKVAREKTVFFWRQYRNAEKGMWNEGKLQRGHAATIVKECCSSFMAGIKPQVIKLSLAVKKLGLDVKSVVQSSGARVATLVKDYWNAERGIGNECKIQLVDAWDTIKNRLTLILTAVKNIPRECKVKMALTLTTMLELLHIRNKLHDDKSTLDKHTRQTKRAVGIFVTACLVAVLHSQTIVPQRSRFISVYFSNANIGEHHTEDLSDSINETRASRTTESAHQANKEFVAFQADTEHELVGEQPSSTDHQAEKDTPAIQGDRDIMAQQASSLSSRKADTDTRSMHADIKHDVAAEQLPDEAFQTTSKDTRETKVDTQHDLASQQPSTSPAVFDINSNIASSPVGFAYVTQKLLEQEEEDEKKKSSKPRQTIVRSIFPIIVP